MFKLIILLVIKLDSNIFIASLKMLQKFHDSFEKQVENIVICSAF